MVPAPRPAAVGPRGLRDRPGTRVSLPIPAAVTAGIRAATALLVALLVAGPVAGPVASPAAGTSAGASVAGPGGAVVGPGAVGPPATTGAGAPAGVGPPSTRRLPGDGASARLVRWDGSGFAPVGPRSVRAPRVHILVHDRLRAARASAPARSDPAGDAVRDLARALGAADPDAAVLAYLWADDAAGKRAAALTDRNGRRLARAWARAVVPGAPSGRPELQLVGEGLGARVATVAALESQPAPDQLTLLDSPERDAGVGGGPAPSPGEANRLAGYLPLLRTGRSAGTTRVDNYHSERGVDYGGDPGLAAVLDVALSPPRGPAVVAGDGHRHRYAARWYTASVRDASAGVGWAWSPLAGGAFPTRPFAFVQARPPREPGTVGPGDLELRARRRRGAPGLRVVAVPVFTRRGPEVGNPRAASARLDAAGPRRWVADVATGRGDLALVLDYRFLRGGRAATLTVRLDGRERAVVDGAAADGRGRRLALDVGGLPPGAHELAFELGAAAPGPRAGRRGPMVAVANLRVLRPAAGAGVRPAGPAARVGAVVLATLVVFAGIAGLSSGARRRVRS